MDIPRDEGITVTGQMGRVGVSISVCSIYIDTVRGSSMR